MDLYELAKTNPGLWSRAGFGDTAAQKTLAGLQAAESTARAHRDAAALAAEGKVQEAKVTSAAYESTAPQVAGIQAAGATERAAQQEQSDLAKAATARYAHEAGIGLKTGAQTAQEANLAQLGQTKATDYFNQLLLSQHGVTDPNDKTGQSKILPDYAKAAALERLPEIKSMEDAPKVLESLRPHLEKMREVSGVDTPENRATALANLRSYRQSQGLPPDAAMEESFKGKITPENYRGFHQWLNFGPQKTGPAARSETPNILDVVTKTGATLKHELTPPGTMLESLLGKRGMTAPSLQDVANRRRAERERLFREEALYGQ